MDYFAEFDAICKDVEERVHNFENKKLFCDKNEKELLLQLIKLTQLKRNSSLQLYLGNSEFEKARDKLSKTMSKLRALRYYKQSLKNEIEITSLFKPEIFDSVKQETCLDAKNSFQPTMKRLKSDIEHREKLLAKRTRIEAVLSQKEEENSCDSGFMKRVASGMIELNQSCRKMIKTIGKPLKDSDPFIEDEKSAELPFHFYRLYKSGLVAASKTEDSRFNFNISIHQEDAKDNLEDGEVNSGENQKLRANKYFLKVTIPSIKCELTIKDDCNEEKILVFPKSSKNSGNNECPLSVEKTFSFGPKEVCNLVKLIAEKAEAGDSLSKQITALKKNKMLKMSELSEKIGPRRLSSLHWQKNAFCHRMKSFAEIDKSKFLDMSKSDYFVIDDFAKFWEVEFVFEKWTLKTFICISSLYPKIKNIYKFELNTAEKKTEFAYEFPLNLYLKKKKVLRQKTDSISMKTFCNRLAELTMGLEPADDKPYSLTNELKFIDHCFDKWIEASKKRKRENALFFDENSKSSYVGKEMSVI